MAGNRTLKLSILGDVDNLNKSLKTASGDVDSFGDKVGKAGIAIGKAFAAAAAAAGAAAIAIGIEGVKAAIGTGVGKRNRCNPGTNQSNRRFNSPNVIGNGCC
jgi:hypothetical protein